MRTRASITALVSLVASAHARSIERPSAADGTRSILITSRLPSPLSSSCLTESYYGSYGGSSASKEHIFLPNEACLADLATLQAVDEGSLVPLDALNLESGRLVWVGDAGLEVEIAKAYPGPSTADGWWSIIRDRSLEALRAYSSDRSSSEGHGAQYHLTAGHEAGLNDPQSITLLHASDRSLLLHVPPFHQVLLDTYLPTRYVPVALPLQPLANAWEPVPKHLAENLANITAHVKFDPKLDTILSQQLDVDQLRRDIRWLTGEAPSGIESRHSFTEGAIKAAHFIRGIAEKSGASCDLFHFLPGFAPDVICTYPSQANSTEHVILSAHYDSRGSFGNTRAPGGDDDGSGSGHLLQIARAVGAAGVKFDKSVTFAWFAGEEQGLYGSHYYAEHLRNKNTTILLQIQADMLGYRVPGEPLQLGLPESIETPEASDLLRAIASIYSPELVLGKTAACCSDHQSFLALGYPSTAVFERNGMIADPMYHNSGDLSQREGYDLDQIISIAKVTMGAVFTVAGWSSKE